MQLVCTGRGTRKMLRGARRLRLLTCGASTSAPQIQHLRYSQNVAQKSYRFPLPHGSVAVWWMDPEKVRKTLWCCAACSAQAATHNLIEQDEINSMLQVPRSYVEKYAHWLTTTELRFICGAGDPLEEHTRLCSRILLRSALATCLGQGLQLSVRASPGPQLAAYQIWASPAAVRFIAREYSLEPCQ